MVKDVDREWSHDQALVAAGGSFFYLRRHQDYIHCPNNSLDTENIQTVVIVSSSVRTSTTISTRLVIIYKGQVRGVR